MLLSAKVLLSSFPLGSKSPLVCQKMSKWCTFFVQDVLRASKNWTMKMLFRSVHMALLETLCRIYMYLHSLSLRPNAFGSAYCILVKKKLPSARVLKNHVHARTVLQSGVEGHLFHSTTTAALPHRNRCEEVRRRVFCEFNDTPLILSSVSSVCPVPLRKLVGPSDIW